MKNVSVHVLLITPLWPVRELNEAMAFWPKCSTPCIASVDTTLLEEHPLRECVCMCFGIVKASSCLNKCRHLRAALGGCLSASYHNLTATHTKTQSPLATLSPFISAWFYSLFHWTNLPCLHHSSGINAAKTDCKQLCLLCWCVCHGTNLLYHSLHFPLSLSCLFPPQMCDCCSTMTIFSGKVLRSKSIVFPGFW